MVRKRKNLVRPAVPCPPDEGGEAARVLIDGKGRRCQKSDEVKIVIDLGHAFDAGELDDIARHQPVLPQRGDDSGIGFRDVGDPRLEAAQHHAHAGRDRRERPGIMIFQRGRNGTRHWSSIAHARRPRRLPCVKRSVPLVDGEPDGK
jgi:hypothetical protein